MSKVSPSSTPSYPSYSGSSISLNGSPLALTSYNEGYLSSGYNMTEAQKQAYNYAQTTLANILPQLNTFSPEVQNTLNSELNSYVQNGVNSINSIYNPMISSLENDIASRFGNLDNSSFMDSLKGIESKRSDAISSFAQDILAKQTSLEDEQLNRQYKYAGFLDGIQNEYYNNALSAISTALNGSSSANSYNSNLYNSLYKQSLANTSSSISDAATLANILGLFSTASLGTVV